MFYIHPYEIGSVCPVVPNLSPERRFRHYFGRTKTRSRVERLFQNHRFGRAIDVLSSLGVLD
jgi:hypothetical protein